MIVVPQTQSQEKKDMLRLAGAELVEVPAVPYATDVSCSYAPTPLLLGQGRRR